jgi:hypothetical protein
MISPRSAPGSKPALTDSELAEPRGFSFLRHCSLTLTAVLVDAGFFLKRATRIYGPQAPEVTARQLHRIALDHLNDDRGHRVSRLYRIFVYDAPPAEWKGHTHWQLTPDVLKALVNGRREWASINDADFRLDLRQKGVDMRIGLDRWPEKCLP